MTWPVTSITYGSYRYFCREVGLYLGYSPAWESWDSEQEGYVDHIVEIGLFQVYQPPAVDGYVHEFSFLKPIGEISTENNEQVYDLPLDFERIDGDLTYVSNDDYFHPLVLTSESAIRALDHLDYKSYPTRAAVRPRQSPGDVQQRQELVLHPIPDAVYRLRFRYHALPRKLSDTYPIPLGGTLFAEVIAASCVAAAELKKIGQYGGMHQCFMNKLGTAIAQDIKRGPNVLGYNADGSRPMRMSRGDARDDVSYTTTTYEGVDYSGA